MSHDAPTVQAPDLRAAAERGVLEFVARHSAAEQAAFLRGDQRTIEYLDYDWGLNARPSR